MHSLKKLRILSKLNARFSTFDYQHKPDNNSNSKAVKSNSKPITKPNQGTFHKFNHQELWVGNAKQSASFYTSKFGFDYLAYSGLETGDRLFTTHVINNGDVIFALKSCNDPSSFKTKEQQDFYDFINSHGDGVKDIAIEVDNIEQIVENCLNRGAKVLQPVTEIGDDSGSIKQAKIWAFGDLIHTFIEKVDYNGKFLPNYKPHQSYEHLNDIQGRSTLNLIDHVGVPQIYGDLEPTVNRYYEQLDWHHFWSVDETLVKSKLSSQRSTVISDYDENVKMPVFQEGPGPKKSQTKEFLEYNNGPGVQHIAMTTDDIVGAVENLKKRGVEFQPSVPSYYDVCQENLEKLGLKIDENLDDLRRNDIQIDFDANGYLLQIFTKHVQDRPTLFLEVLQRKNFNGFGVGNFGRLFEAIEREQAKRGNLTDNK